MANDVRERRERLDAALGPCCGCPNCDAARERVLDDFERIYQGEAALSAQEPLREAVRELVRCIKRVRNRDLGWGHYNDRPCACPECNLAKAIAAVEQGEQPISGHEFGMRALAEEQPPASEGCGCRIPYSPGDVGGDSYKTVDAVNCRYPAAAEKARELAAMQIALRIMLDGSPGAALNAVREDYPEWAERVDRLAEKARKYDAGVEAIKKRWAQIYNDHANESDYWEGQMDALDVAVAALGAGEVKSG